MKSSIECLETSLSDLGVPKTPGVHCPIATRLGGAGY